MIGRITLCYSAGILLWSIARLIYADQIWWLALLNTVALWLFFPLLFIAALVLATRHWRSLLALAVPSGIFCLLYGPLLLPRLTPLPAEPTTKLRVMTFNILYQTSTPDQLEQLLNQTQPDLVGLQEVNQLLALQLPKELTARYPFQAFDVDGPEAGVALLSRYPIIAAEPFALPPRNLALRTTIDLNGTAVTVLVAHLSPNRLFSTPPPELPATTTAFYSHQNLEITDLLAALPPAEQPALLLCDCNMTDTSAAYGRLATTLTDSFREAGWGLGLSFRLAPFPLPLQRIDYIWHSAPFVATNAFVGPDSGSDHLPVVGEFSLLYPPTP
jgi:vancomycin resistance protein VanJ